MDCSKVQDELLHGFGKGILDGAVEEHLSRCDKCRRLRDEMIALGDTMGTDEDFYPDANEARLVLERVERAIEQPRITRMNRYRPIAIAASVVLVVGVSLVSFMMGRHDSAEITSPMLVADSAEYLNSQVSLSELDQSALDEIMRDFTSDHGFESSDLLLDDISEEELQYLEKNFDVKDLL